MPSTRYTVARADLHDIRAEDEATIPLDEGQVRLQIDLVALTANNITYAAFGDAMHYWDVYPCADPSRGCIPVWGFSNVVETRCPGVEVGERCYGFWPMAQQVVVSPVKPGPGGFFDGAPHRRTLAAVYNQVLRCRSDPLYQRDQEPAIALLRPLFTTAFLIDDFLADAAWFGAGAVWLSSASSKTAAATAFNIARRRGTDSAVRICGLTSAANEAYTRGLGIYDEVRSYESLAELDQGDAAVYVDFSGSAALRSAVHHRLGDRLRHSSAVGGTHWEGLAGSQDLPGPRPTLFFAPAQVKRRLADWGEAGFGRRLASAWQAFLKPVNDPLAPWMRVVHRRGREEVMATYLALLDGRLPAIEGQVLSP